MKIPTEGKLLRIFVGVADRWGGKPLYEAIVEEARTRGLAGATDLAQHDVTGVAFEFLGAQHGARTSI